MNLQGWQYSKSTQDNKGIITTITIFSEEYTINKSKINTRIRTKKDGE